MTHRHKNQTDEYERLERKRRVVESAILEFDQLPEVQKEELRRQLRPTDSNHGSRTDSNTRGGKA